MNEAIDQSSRELHACVVPWREGASLLLPNAVIAETLYHLEIIPLANESSWIQGGVEWRGQTVPLVSFDGVPDLPARVTDETRRVLICHTLSFSEEHAYVAIDFFRLPRLVFIDESSFSVVEEGRETNDWPFVARIDVRGSVAYVLDMEKLCGLF